MIEVLSWISTKEGISDLRRFWGVRADEIEDVSFDEMEAFYETVPPESATQAATNKTTLGIQSLLLAEIIDALVRLQYTTAGSKKRPNKNNFIAPNFKVSSKDTADDFKKRIIRKRALEKLVK